MSEKVSILTLRLTAEEAAQMEVLKSITGKKSGSEAIKYIVKEYPDSVPTTSRRHGRRENCNASTRIRKSLWEISSKHSKDCSRRWRMTGSRASCRCQSER